ncbi:MAG: cytochrome c [Halopseudomonas sp.]
MSESRCNVASSSNLCWVWWVFALSLHSIDAAAESDSESAQQRGEYIFKLAGCRECHTDPDGQFLAGGRALETPFGVFYSPNITPHPIQGIGRWQLLDFHRALRHGEAPDGRDYYPVFPFVSYTGMSDGDIVDLWLYLQSIPPVDQQNLPHQLGFPFSVRELMWGWKLLFFEAGEFTADLTRTERWNRGAYLVRALAHCGECHTPRSSLGAIDLQSELGGNLEGPDGDVVPNITPDQATGIGEWTVADIDALLEMGLLPDADFVGGSMGDVVDNTTSNLTEYDRRAMIDFLRQLPAVYRPDLHSQQH